MDDAQRYALEHPLNRADDVTLLQRLTTDTVIPGGNLLRVILAIDR
jgi:hypothetical protein